MGTIANSFGSAEIVILLMLFIVGIGSIFCVTIVGTVSVLVRVTYHILLNLLGTKSNDNNIK